MRRALPALAALLVLAAPAPARAADNTTIGFDNVGAGVEITNQYTSDGVSFGSGSFGGVGPDCANLLTQSGSDPAPHTDPNFVQLGDCIGGQRGATGGFNHGRTRVRLFVRVTDGLTESMT